MTREVVTVNPDTTLGEVKELFSEKQISGAPVTDDKGELVGVISVSDLIRSENNPEPYHREGYWIDFSVLAQSFQVVDDDTAVSEVMSTTSFHVGEMTPLHNVTSLMTLHHLHRVIVTRGRREVCGIISSLDLVRHLGDRLVAELKTV